MYYFCKIKDLKQHHGTNNKEISYRSYDLLLDL